MPWTADGRWVPENDSVAANLTGLLASDSKYIRQARAGGQRTAARRGLLNTSIAAGAAESGAIAAAAPIASQDASQTFQRNQAVLEGNINLDTQTKLQDQQIAGQKELNTQQNQAAQELQRIQDTAAKERLQLQESGATERQLAEFDQRTAEQVRGIEADAARQTQQLSSQERQAQLGADTNLLQSQIGANSNLTGQYLSAFSQLASNPEIPAETRNAYIREFQRVLTQGQALIGAVQSVPLNWGAGATA
jgi:hypothetical protein